MSRSVFWPTLYQHAAIRFSIIPSYDRKQSSNLSPMQYRKCYFAHSKAVPGCLRGKVTPLPDILSLWTKGNGQNN